MVDDKNVQLFVAEAGQTYWVAVIGAEGVFELTIDDGPPEADHDDFATAKDFGSGYFASDEFSFFGSSVEPGEPWSRPSGEGTVWWKWVAPENAVVQFDFMCPSGLEFDVFQGSELTNLNRLTESCDPSLWLPVSANETYYIRAKATFRNITPNDRFGIEFIVWTSRNGTYGEAYPLGTTSHAHHSSMFHGAFVEDGEVVPDPGITQYSVWRKWSAPSDGLLHLDVSHHTSVFRDSGALVTLEHLVDVSDSLILPVEVGSEFVFASYSTHARSPTSRDQFTLRFEAIEPANNDVWANRSVVDALPMAWSGFDFRSTYEAGELSLPESPGSLWWEWKADHTGPVFVLAQNGVEVAAYRGDGVLVDLEPMIPSEDGPDKDIMVIEVVEGENYHFQIGSVAADRMIGFALTTVLMDNLRPEVARPAGPIPFRFCLR